MKQPWLCEQCHNYYLKDERFDDEFDKKCVENGSHRAIIKCACGHKRLIGGELYKCLNDIHNRSGIAMYEYVYDENHKLNIPVFGVTMLVECDQGDPDCIMIFYSRKIDDRGEVVKTRICDLKVKS